MTALSLLVQFFPVGPVSFDHVNHRLKFGIQLDQSLVQWRADSINPLQLEPRQLVLPVSIKDGLKQKSQNLFTPTFVAGETQEQCDSGSQSLKCCCC